MRDPFEVAEDLAEHVRPGVDDHLMSLIDEFVEAGEPTLAVEIAVDAAATTGLAVPPDLIADITRIWLSGKYDLTRIAGIVTGIETLAADAAASGPGAGRRPVGRPASSDEAGGVGLPGLWDRRRTAEGARGDAAGRS